jgi:hypothetical protein
MPDLPDGTKAVKIAKKATPGQDIRQIGSDIACAPTPPCFVPLAHVLLTSWVHTCRAGTVVLDAGARIGPAEVGLLATVGANTVKVFRQPKVSPALQAPHPFAPPRMPYHTPDGCSRYVLEGINV